MDMLPAASIDGNLVVLILEKHSDSYVQSNAGNRSSNESVDTNTLKEHLVTN
jgi:hypothetical protein